MFSSRRDDAWHWVIDILLSSRRGGDGARGVTTSHGSPRRSSPWLQRRLFPTPFRTLLLLMVALVFTLMWFLVLIHPDLPRFRSSLRRFHDRPLIVSNHDVVPLSRRTPEDPLRAISFEGRQRWCATNGRHHRLCHVTIADGSMVENAQSSDMGASTNSSNHMFGWDVDIPPTNPVRYATHQFSWRKAVDSNGVSTQGFTTLPQASKTTVGSRRLTLPLYRRIFEHTVLRAALDRLKEESEDREHLAEGNKPGSRTRVEDSDKSAGGVLDVTLYWSLLHRADPRLLYLHHVAPQDLRQRLVRRANATLQRSTVVMDGNGNGAKGGGDGGRPSDSADAITRNQVHAVRTSFSTFLSTFDDRTSPENVALRCAVSYLVGVPESFLEPTQVIRYLPGEYYVSHLDFFDLGDEVEMKRGGQRVATALIWLNDVAEGGATTFPIANVSITPRAGDGVVFYNVKEAISNRPTGRFDPDRTAIHSGDPPKGNNTKWVAVIWVHGQPYL